MAQMDHEELDALTAEGPEALTPHTIVDPSTSSRELALIRERGYATPIRTLDGRVIVAVTASGPRSG